MTLEKKLVKEKKRKQKMSISPVRTRNDSPLKEKVETNPKGTKTPKERLTLSLSEIREENSGSTDRLA